MNKKALMEVLETAATVTFFKQNGDTREMKAIINPDGQPINYSKSDAVSVIDVVSGAFKAIKAGTVLSINGEMV